MGFVNFSPIKILRGIVLSYTFSSFFTAANEFKKAEEFRGIAKDATGKIAYIESHQLIMNAKTGALESSSTRYESEDKKLLATLTSNYTISLTSPDHVFKNEMDGSLYGVRNEGESITMFKKSMADQIEKTKKLEQSFAGSSLVVGCQGLNYYIRNQISSIKNSDLTPIAFLIPGRLEYFNFNMKNKGVLASILQIELKAANFFVRLFAPKMNIKYDANSGRLIHYEGISNILKTDGNTQNVVIDYEYKN